MKKTIKEEVITIEEYEGKREARIIRLAIEALPDNLLRRVIVKVDGNDLVSEQEFDFRPPKK